MSDHSQYEFSLLNTILTESSKASKEETDKREAVTLLAHELEHIEIQRALLEAMLSHLSAHSKDLTAKITDTLSTMENNQAILEGVKVGISYTKGGVAKPAYKGVAEKLRDELSKFREDSDTLFAEVVAANTGEASPPKAKLDFESERVVKFMSDLAKVNPDELMSKVGVEKFEKLPALIARAKAREAKKPVTESLSGGIGVVLDWMARRIAPAIAKVQPLLRRMTKRAGNIAGLFGMTPEQAIALSKKK